MHPRKWISNSPELLECVPVEDRAVTINLASGELPSTKTLGVLWSAESDDFSFRLPDASKSSKLTERPELQSVESIFDPLGFIAPLSVQAKLILQDMWVASIDWNELLPPSIDENVWKWFAEFVDFPSVRVPICLIPSRQDHSTVQIHVFADASEIHKVQSLIAKLPALTVMLSVISSQQSHESHH